MINSVPSNLLTCRCSLVIQSCQLKSMAVTMNVVSTEHDTSFSIVHHYCWLTLCLLHRIINHVLLYIMPYHVRTEVRNELLFLHSLILRETSKKSVQTGFLFQATYHKMKSTLSRQCQCFHQQELNKICLFAIFHSLMQLLMLSSAVVTLVVLLGHVSKGIVCHLHWQSETL